MTLETLLIEYNFLAAPLLLIIIYIIIRFALINSVKKWSVKDPKNKQNWLFIAKQLPKLILMIGILLIWGQELRDLALSLVAVAAAIVLATKEVILCFMGGLLKVSTKLFEIDDRISVSGFRGKVKDHNLMTTELLEIGPGPKSNQTTGKILKVPNSIFLSNAVSIVPSEHDFILHIITMTLPYSEFKVLAAELQLLEAAKTVISQFSEELSNFKSRNPEIVREFNLNQEPKVFVDLNARDSFDISLRLCLPYDRMSKLENDIKMNFIRISDTKL